MKKNILLALLCAIIPTVSWPMMMEGDMGAIDRNEEPADAQHVAAEENLEREEEESAGIPEAKAPSKTSGSDAGGVGSTVKKPAAAFDGGQDSQPAPSIGFGPDAEGFSTAETVMDSSLSRGLAEDNRVMQQEGLSGFFGSSNGGDRRTQERVDRQMRRIKDSSTSRRPAQRSRSWFSSFGDYFSNWGRKTGDRELRERRQASRRPEQRSRSWFSGWGDSLRRRVNDFRERNRDVNEWKRQQRVFEAEDRARDARGRNQRVDDWRYKQNKFEIKDGVRDYRRQNYGY